MIKLRLIAFLILIFSGSPSLYAEPYKDTLEIFKGATGESALFDEAYGYAIFPTIGKGGFYLGAAYGAGRLYKSGELAGEVKMTQLSIGFQLGGQTYSQIILLQDARAYDEFVSGTFEFGVQANAVAIVLSAGAETSTKGSGTSVTNGKDPDVDGDYYKGMAVFTLAKGGLMYEVSIGGQKFKFRPMRNMPQTEDLSIEKVN